MSDTTTNHDLLLKSEIPTNELADGELDERDLEAINGGWGRPKPPNPGDKDDGIFESVGAGIDNTLKKGWDWLF